jgi:hypothetical protein
MTSRRLTLSLLILALVLCGATLTAAKADVGLQTTPAHAGKLGPGSPQGPSIAAYCEGTCSNGGGFYCSGATATCVDGSGCTATGSDGSRATYTCGAS